MATTFLIRIDGDRNDVTVSWNGRSEPAPGLRTQADHLQELFRRAAMKSPLGHLTLTYEVASVAGTTLAEALPEPLVNELEAAIERRPVERLKVAWQFEPNAFWHQVPWELLRLPHLSLPPALSEHVVFYRRLQDTATTPSLGPLPFRVLFAVAAPDRQASDRRLSLDWEREEELIYQALTKNAPEVVLEEADEGHPEYLVDLAQSFSPHVLHLSGHGLPGGMELEDELGFQKILNPGEFQKDLLDRLPDATRLLVLSQCYSSTPEPEGSSSEAVELLSFAALSAQRLGQAVGMHFPVADEAGAWWAAGFYKALAANGYQDVAGAVAAGRRRMFEENEKRRADAPEAFDRVDWAAPVLYAVAEPFPLASEESDERLAVAPPPSLADINPHRDRRSFVGRRRERRRLLRAVRQDAVVALSLSALGGTGKSTMAAHLIERLASRSAEKWRWVYVKGRITVSGLVRKVADKTQQDPIGSQQQMRRQRQSARRLLKEAEGDEDRLTDALCDLLRGTVEAGGRWVLIFDDFEENQTRPGEDLPSDLEKALAVDPAVARLLDRLASTACRWEDVRMLLIFTSRLRPVIEMPQGSESRFRHVAIGPLGQGEQRKQAIRLQDDALDWALESSWEALGGHPRALEILALLQALSGGHQQVVQRIERFLSGREGLVELIREKASQEADAPAVAAEIAAQDAMLGATLGRLNPEERDILGALTLFEADFDQRVLPAIGRIVASGHPVQEGIGQRLVTLGLVAPLPFAAQMSDGRPGQRLLTVPKLLRGRVEPPSSEVGELHAVAARHLGQRYEAELLALDERLALAEALVGHSIKGCEWRAGKDAAGFVLRVYPRRGEWDRGQRLGQQWLAESESDDQALWRIVFRSQVAWRLSEILASRAPGEEIQQILFKQIEETRRVKSVSSSEEEHRALDEQLSRLTFQAAQVVSRIGDPAQARVFLKESLEIDRRLGDRQGESASLHQLAQIETRQGDFPAARRLLERSLEIFRRLGDRQGESASLHQLALIETRQGDFPAARRLLERSLDIDRRLGDRQGESASLHLLAQIETRQGDFPAARRLLERSLEILRRLGDRQGESASLHQLAQIEIQTDQRESAIRHWRESIAINARLGDPEGAAMSRIQLGQALLEENPLQGLTMLEEGVRTARQLKLAEVGLAEKILGQAAQGLSQAIDAALADLDDESRAGGLFLRGVCRRLLAQNGPAEEDLQESRELNRRQGNPSALAAISGQLGRLQQGRPPSGAQQAEHAEQAARQCLDHPQDVLAFLRGWQPDSPVDPAEIGDLIERLVALEEELQQKLDPGQEAEQAAAWGEFMSELGRTEDALSRLRTARRLFEQRDPSDEEARRQAQACHLAEARLLPPPQGLRLAAHLALQAESRGETPLLQRALSLAASRLDPSTPSAAGLWVAALSSSRDEGPGPDPQEALDGAERLAGDDPLDTLLAADALARILRGASVSSEVALRIRSLFDRSGPDHLTPSMRGLLTALEESPS